ncbi:hypothetical protein P9J83_15930 [Clostridium sporogenes]|uniref:Uncharacterized protein n=1 Tax=Clostridium sporogenes TaxID=1509 RepID=A0AAE4JWB1_CLOSG|nr:MULTISPECIES: hypothetical protein [Clostridium]KOR24154.1 hypothetical protein ND00_28600 [Clostridium sp. L74]MDS1004974.1 hypothetical protein [Clostridium sporogenes]
MDKSDKDALVYRLNWVLKYAEEGEIENIKNEVESLIDEINHYDLVVPF